MNAYLFDVDGVLNSMTNKTISNQDLIVQLVILLRKGAPLGFISGRGLLWLRSSVIKVLENYLSDHPGFEKNLLDSVYVSGEFGGVTCTHQNGAREESVNQEFVIPDEIRRGLHLISFQYSEYIFIDSEKQTVFTVQANHSLKEEEFQTHKQALIDEFANVIASHPELEVQSDRLAINIRYKNANKGNATGQFLKWLSPKNLQTERFYIFGDSPSDLEMGEELQKQKKDFTFIYVGHQSEVTQYKPSFPLTFTKKQFDEGTLEFLTSLNN